MARDIKEIQSYLLKFINDTVTTEMLKMFAEEIKLTIYRRTKTGKGLSKYNDKNPIGGSTNVPLEKLSKQYRDYRKNKILGPFASANKSNLTFSGELLESILIKVVGKKAIVEIDDAKHSSGVNLKQLAHYVSEQGRPFFGLSDSELKRIESLMRRTIRDNIRRLQKIQ